MGVLEARSDVHLVFADAEMPGTMDGIELVHYIRSRWPPVKLIVVSGKTDIAPEELPPAAKFSLNLIGKTRLSKRWSACSLAGVTSHAPEFEQVPGCYLQSPR